MRPKIDRQKFNEVTDENLVQLIAESHEFNNDEILDDSQKSLISRRLEVCELINRIEFTIESYGTINFFVDYENEIQDLKRLSELLREFNESDIIETIEKTFEFYINNEERFIYLRSLPEDFSKKHEELHNEYITLDKPKTGVWYNIPLHKGIEKLAKYIRNNPDEFCVDKNGKTLKSS